MEPRTHSHRAPRHDPSRVPKAKPSPPSARPTPRVSVRRGSHRSGSFVETSRRRSRNRRGSGSSRQAARRALRPPRCPPGALCAHERHPGRQAGRPSASPTAAVLRETSDPRVPYHAGPWRSPERSWRGARGNERSLALPSWRSDSRRIQGRTAGHMVRDRTPGRRCRPRPASWRIAFRASGAWA